MDNDLMARRLRPPSQPNSGNGASGQPQPPSPWDVPLTEDGSFAVDQSRPQNDPPFAPPDPAAREDIPWDRPAAEAWPPREDSGTDYQQTWSANAGMPATPSTPSTPSTPEARAEWPAADAVGDETPWDRPVNDQSLDPDDAMAPVVGDVHAAAGIWHEWSGNGNGHAAANGNGNGNGNGHAAASGNGYSNASFNGAGYGAGAKGGGRGIKYGATPEPMSVTAQSDQPRSGDEPRADQWVDAFDTSPSNPGNAMAGGSGSALPEWPAEDDLTPPSSGRGPVMPEDSWPVTPQEAPPAAAPAPWEQADAAVPAMPAAPEPTPAAAPVRVEQPAMPPAPIMPPQPVNPAPAPSGVTPVVKSAQIVPSPAGSPQNMVLRIELAIVDESHRANPADAAKRVGPDADVRAPDFNPRTHGGRAPMPEPEYEWGAPSRDAQDPRNQRQQPQPRHVAPPSNAWQPAPTQPGQFDWGLPQVGGAQPGPMQPDQPAPWSTPNQPQQRQAQLPPPPAPAPTWAMTEPQAPYQPEPPQYMPPPPAPQYQQPAAPQYQQPAAPQYPGQGYPQPAQSAWPPARSTDPLYGVPAAPNQQTYGQPHGYQPSAYTQPAPPMPAQSQYPAPSVQSAPAAGTRARNGQANAAADQADLWFLSNQPGAATVADDDAKPTGKSSSLLTAGLTVGFALLVIVLVLVFIQLMTSLLK